MKQYFETVDVKDELPEIDTSEVDWATLEWSGTVFIITKDGGKKQGFYAYRERSWYSNGKLVDFVTHWLRPVDLREVAGKAFDAGFNKGHADGSDIEKFTNHPDKETYLNSLPSKP